jgi:alkylation response protein AidB-like acyl-CoA dehydrogenase
MDFNFTDEQKELQAWAHDFAVREIRPVAAKYDANQEFPWPVLKKAAEAGLYGIDIYLQHQSDPTGLTLPLIMEEIFWGDAGIGMAIFGTGLTLAALAGSGTPEQLFEFGPGLFGTVDEPKVGAFAVSEPQAGSDVRALRTKAVLDGDEWVISGTKVWISNGSVADTYIVVATVDHTLGHRGQASFVVLSSDPGIRPGKKEDKLGIRASDTSEVILDECRIPAERVLGGMDKLNRKLEKARNGESSRGSGALRTFETTRPFVAVMAVGVARAALEFAVNYAREREAFGDQIIHHQAIAFMLADMACEVETARLITHKAAWLAASGNDFPFAEGSMSKLFAGRTVRHVTERAVQVLGGYGFVKDFPVERWYRDAKIFEIFEGTEQMQQKVVGRALEANI